MTPLRFAIHAHVYYRELWPELATCIRNFADYEHNLFITTPHADDTRDIPIYTWAEIARQFEDYFLSISSS